MLLTVRNRLETRVQEPTWIAFVKLVCGNIAHMTNLRSVVLAELGFLSALPQIDRMMLAAHRLGLTNKISNFEVNNFAVSLTEVESILVVSVCLRSGTSMVYQQFGISCY